MLEERERALDDRDRAGQSSPAMFDALSEFEKEHYGTEEAKDPETRKEITGYMTQVGEALKGIDFTDIKQGSPEMAKIETRRILDREYHRVRRSAIAEKHKKHKQKANYNQVKFLQAIGLKMLQNFGLQIKLMMKVLFK